MNEATKTLLFCGIAAVTGAIAFATRPQPVVIKPEEEIGRPLFKDFSDPTKAATLKIVSHNQDVGRTSSFEVAKKSGSWVIPSHNDYPADAADQMRDVATGFVDLKVIRFEDAKPADHELFGVVQPNPEQSQSGAKGIGTLVEFGDESSKPLAKLILGQEVKDAPGQRYVRVPGQDRVYVVEIDPKRFSTKFEDWVEADLLKLNPLDVSELVLNDYSVEIAQTLQGLALKSYDQRLELVTREDTANNKWVVKSFRESRNNELQDSQLLEGEELNKERLDGLKNALDDLKIVDVERKPAGLRADLKADEGFLKDEQGVASLFEKGFYPVQMRGRPDVDLLCSDGEVKVRTKDGVEYMLRFGGIASLNREEGKEGSVNRWLFVTARVDESQFPDPILEPLPEITGEGTDAAPATTAPAGSTPADATPADGTPAEPAAEVTSEAQVDADGTGAPAESTPEASAPAEANPDAAPNAGDAEASSSPEAETSGSEGACGEETPAADSDPAESSAPETTATTTEPPATTAPAATAEPPAAAAPANEAAEPAANPSTPPVDPGDVREQQRKERDRIMKENQRKLDEHNEKLKKAQQKVGELNFRFADWYYIISDEVFRKIHLSRSDVIIMSEAAKKEGAGLDSLRDLQQKAQGANLQP